MKNLIIVLLLSTILFSCNNNDNLDVPEGFVAGTILETMDAGGYTYMKLDEDGTENWVAATTMKVAVGDVVFYSANSHVMKDFHSKSMDMTFDKIVFADKCMKADEETAESDEHSGMPGSGNGMMGQGNPHKGKSADRVSGIDLEAAEDGHTIEQIYAKRDELNGKSVKVLGQVVKYNAGIMNRNWLHIQDGSGTDNDYDLVITTSEEFKVGDIVSFEGILAVDKDFGSGYKYVVIVEDAVSLTKPVTNS